MNFTRIRSVLPTGGARVAQFEPVDADVRRSLVRHHQPGEAEDHRPHLLQQRRLPQAGPAGLRPG